MITWTEISRAALLLFLLLVYASGAAGHAISPAFFLPFTPLAIALTILVFLLFQPFDRAYLLTFAGVACIGYLTELLGVHTGMVFGNYRYGGSLGPLIGGVPPLIALNWALLACAAVAAISSVTKGRWTGALLAAGLITLTDFLIEQVAGRLDYWHFEHEKAGLHNYAGWFVLVFVVAFFFRDQLLRGNPVVARIILALQLFYFGTIIAIQLFNFI